MPVNYSITGNDFLYRRIPKDNPYCWKEINGIKVPSSANFKTNKGEDGLSVNIAALTTPEKVIARHPKNDLAEFSALTPINERYNCLHKPSKKNVSHAIIEGNTNPIAKKLSKVVTNVFQF